jgi:peptidoglycan hydrolase-like protein with peptidoglycan-binding domain
MEEDMPEFPILQMGSSGTEVGLLQSALTVLGLDIADDAAEEFGAGTESAVRSFQSGRGLDATGAVDQGTWEALAALPFTKKVQVSADDTPSLARVVTFSNDVDAWLRDLGIEPPVSDDNV